MNKFEPYFQKSLSWSFFIKLIIFPLNMYVKELFRWASFPMDFISWLITIEGPLNIGFKLFFHFKVDQKWQILESTFFFHHF